MANPNPNLSTRFQKGNPGRRKGTPNRISYEILDALEKKASDDENAKSNLESLIDVLLDEALRKKNMKAVEILLDRGFGKAKEIIEAQISAVRIIDSIDEGELLEEGEEEKNESSYLESGGITSS